MNKKTKITLTTLAAATALTLAYHLLTYGGAPIQHTPSRHPTPHIQQTTPYLTYTQPTTIPQPPTPTKTTPNNNQTTKPTPETPPPPTPEEPPTTPLQITDEMFASYISLAENDFQDIFDPTLQTQNQAYYDQNGQQRSLEKTTFNFKDPYGKTEFDISIARNAANITIRNLDDQGVPYGPESTIQYYTTRFFGLHIQYNGADGTVTTDKATDIDLQDFRNLLDLAERLAKEQKTQIAQEHP